VEQDLVAQPDELGTLVPQRLEDRAHLGQRGVRFVEVEESGHSVILARRGHRARRRQGNPER
jgi:hypothetical protein